MTALPTNSTEASQSPSFADYLDYRMPVRLERILVGVDFSEESLKALQYASSFARIFGSQIFVVYARRRTHFRNGITPDELDSNLRLFTERELGRACKWQSLVQIGKPHEEIVSIARARQVDLIIMSSHLHRGGLRCGNASSRVASRAPCPILLLREPEHEFIHVTKGQ